MIKTKDLYLRAGHNSTDLYVMTNEERLKLQAHLRKMYIEIERVCERHGLQMMVAYGSVLGAIRHNGFIPWDDDMDLLMPRDDYDRLINDYADELPGNYKIYAPNSKNGPICRFAKVVDTSTRFLEPNADDSEQNGIFIDIFALENTPVSLPKVRCRRLITCGLEVIASCVQDYNHENDFYKNMICSTRAGRQTYRIRKFIGKLFSFFNETRWFNIYDKFVHYKKDTGYYAVPTGESGKWQYFKPYPKDLYIPAKRMKFDDIDVFVPNQSEKHCEIEYGDWKQIPPENERWQHFIKCLKFEQK